MKKLLWILLLSPMLSFAQTDTAKIKPAETFCIMRSEQTLFSEKYIIDYGKKEKDYTPQQQKEESGISVVKSFVEALNYMSQQGWIFVSLYTTPIDNKAGIVSQNVVYRRGL